MSQLITKSEKSIQTLNKLIASGYYKGEIQENRFDLTRSDFIVNHKIVGVLNSHSKFETKSINKNPLLYKFFLLIYSIICFLSLLKGNWILSFILILFLTLILGIDYYKKRKEMKLFTKKFLSYSVKKE